MINTRLLQALIRPTSVPRRTRQCQSRSHVDDGSKEKVVLPAKRRIILCVREKEGKEPATTVLQSATSVSCIGPFRRIRRCGQWKSRLQGGTAGSLRGSGREERGSSAHDTLKLNLRVDGVKAITLPVQIARTP